MTIAIAETTRTPPSALPLGSPPESATLLAACAEPSEVIAALTDFVRRHGGKLLELDQHIEPPQGRSFLRMRWDTRGFALDAVALRAHLARLGKLWSMDWSLFDSVRPPRVAILASTLPHCLRDLLLAERAGDMGGRIAAVVANHETLASVAQQFSVPFHHIPVTDKRVAEDRQLALLESLEIDLVVLARYMQILSPRFVAGWSGRIINVHHSLLPAFIGGRPYHQAWQRGVKMIGATAHYVTDELDQGPIIEQEGCRVSHRDGVDQLIRRGCELERQVLTRAVRWHLDHRVLVAGTRTVVFA
jgi:formyltetrahydrofolate deformylase